VSDYNQDLLYNQFNYYNGYLDVPNYSAVEVALDSEVLGNLILGSYSDVVVEINSSAEGKITVVMNTFAHYMQAIKSSTREPVYLIEFLDEEENVISSLTPDLISGNLSLNYQSGTRKSLNMTLVNKDGVYIPIPEANLWINTKFKLSTGLRINNMDYFINRGIFVLSEPENTSRFAEKTATITALDKWALLDGTLGGELESDYIISVDTPIETAVRQIFLDAGEIKPVIIDGGLGNTPYTITEEAGSNYSSILFKLAEMLSFEVYYNADGYPVFTAPVDVDSEPIQFVFNTDEVLYLGSSHKYKYPDIKNYIVVIGDNINGDIFSAIAQDANALSPTRVSLIGKKVKVIRDDLIYTDLLAQQRADYELKKRIALFESVDFSAIPVDIINEGNIVTIDDSSNNLHGDRYIVQSVSFPLNFNGEMNITMWKNRDLGAS
jgi:hypothetical protein